MPTKTSEGPQEIPHEGISRMGSSRLSGFRDAEGAQLVKLNSDLFDTKRHSDLSSTLGISMVDVEDLLNLKSSIRQHTSTTKSTRIEPALEDEEWSTEIREAISRLKVKNSYGAYKDDVGAPVFDLQVKKPVELVSHTEMGETRSLSNLTMQSNDLELPMRGFDPAVSETNSLDETLAVGLSCSTQLRNVPNLTSSFISSPPECDAQSVDTNNLQTLRTKSVSFPNDVMAETPMNLPSPPPGSVITCHENDQNSISEPTADNVQDSLSALRNTLNALESQVMSAIIPSDEYDSQGRDDDDENIERKNEIKNLMQSPTIPEERHSSPPVLNTKPWKVRSLDSTSKGWCCKLHDKEFTAWCYQGMCNKMVCPECVKEYHVGHGLMKIPKQQEMDRSIEKIKNDDILEDFDLSLFEAPQQMKYGFVQRAEMHRRNISDQYNNETYVKEVLTNIEKDTTGLFDEATKRIEYLTGKLNATTATWNTCRRRVVVTPSEQEQPLFAPGYSSISSENRLLVEQSGKTVR